MNAVALCKLALKNGARFSVHFLRLARTGKLNPRFVWLGARGVGEYIEMIAAGDVASDEAVDERRGVCRTCPSRRPDPDDGESLGFCGPPFEDHPEGVPPTCGCPLDAATCQASRGCPQRRYPPVKPTFSATTKC